MKRLLQRLTGRRPNQPGGPAAPLRRGGVSEPDRPAGRGLTIVDAGGAAAKPAVAGGTRIYAVGDVHGQLESLRDVLRKIRTDIAARPAAAVYTVFVGDYVDRGLASRSVIDAIMSENGIGTKIPLRGNHEEVMLAALDDAGRMRRWCDLGGIQTMFSYGVDVRELMLGRGFEAARAALLAAIPPSHVAWLRGLPACWETGGYFFCHAGINPNKPLDAQRNADLLWIRDGFMRDERAFAKIIVHGHSPVERIDIRHNRINVDTGAFCTGHLGCISLENESVACL